MWQEVIDIATINIATINKVKITESPKNDVKVTTMRVESLYTFINASHVVDNPRERDVRDDND